MTWSLAANQFITIQGDLRNGEEEADAKCKQSRGGTIGPARVRIVQHQIGTATLHLMKNGTSQFSTQITGSGPETREFGSGVSFSAGEDLQWKLAFENGQTGQTDILSYIAAKVVYG